MIALAKLVSVFRFSGYGCIKSRVLFLTYASRDLYLTFILPRGINMNDKRVISGGMWHLNRITITYQLSYILKELGSRDLWQIVHLPCLASFIKPQGYLRKHPFCVPAFELLSCWRHLSYESLVELEIIT